MHGLSLVISLAVDLQHLHVITGATSKKGLFSCHRFWESSSFEGFKDAGKPTRGHRACFYFWKLLLLLETLEILLVRGSLTF